MHEMGIATQIITIASKSIPKEMDGCRVKRVNVEVGRLSAVVPASLTFCFDIASKETALSGAKLAIEEIPITALCNSCLNEWHIDEADFSCPSCGSGDIELISGQELHIVSIEMAD